MKPGIVSQDQEQAARNQIATLALSMYQIHGLPAPGPDELGSIVRRAEAFVSLHQLRHPESITASALGQIDQLVLSAAEAKRRPTNIYSADAARAAQAADGAGRTAGKTVDTIERLRGGSSSARSREIANDGGSGTRSDSGARYDTMSSAPMGAVEWGTPRGLAITRGYALGNNMAWATSQSELMRLGQPALQALHEVNFQKQSFEKLTKDASFKAKEIVTLARFAKKEHIDANHLAGEVSHGVKALAGNNIPERRKIDTALTGYMEHPERPDTKKHLFKTLDPYADDPKKKPEVYRMLDAVKIKREEFDAAHKANGPSHQAADVKQDKARQEAKKAEVKVASFDALPDDPPKANGDAPKPNAPASKPSTTTKTAVTPAANQPKPS